MYNHHLITELFEKELSDYCGSPFALAFDNCTSAIFTALWYESKIMKRTLDTITIPAHTYVSVPCSIINCGLHVSFEPSSPFLKGEYQLKGSRIYDSALLFTNRMYRKGFVQALSFTGPFKTLKLLKGGALLTDDIDFVKWAKKFRFSGRDNQSYHTDDFDINPVIGHNFYMPSDTAARGLLLMQSFYRDGIPKPNEPVELPYPDLSRFKIYQ